MDHFLAVGGQLVQHGLGGGEQIQRSGNAAAYLKQAECQPVFAALLVFARIAAFNQHAQQPVGRADVQTSGGSQVGQGHPLWCSGERLRDI